MTIEINMTTISREQYERWQQHFTLHALTGQRYGQSFCNYFGITDNLLYFTSEPTWCDDYIQKSYVRP